jgi:hypothetical protein
MNTRLEDHHFNNKYLRKIFNWCYEYFETQTKAPKKNIQSIFDIKSQSLKDEEADAIQDILVDLSEKYEDASPNYEYLLEITNKYIFLQEATIKANNILAYVQKDDPDGIAREMLALDEATKRSLEEHIVDLGDVDKLEELHKKKSSDNKEFFKMPGDLGKVIGNMKRSDVVSLFAETKVGKTWMLTNFFKICVQSGLRTVYFSIEMTQEEITERVMQAFFPLSTNDGEDTFPEFDCLKNQTGDCIDRTSKVVVSEGEEFIDDPNHVVCQKCMRTCPERYEQVIYHSRIKREKLDLFGIQKGFRKKNGNPSAISKMMGKYGRIITKDKYNMSFWDVIHFVKHLRAQGFIPDVIIIDYADILDFESKNIEWRKEDDRWKLLPKLYSFTKSLLITATQAKSSDGEFMSSENQRGYKGKSMHVNKMIGISQTPEQKRDGIIQVNVTESREGKFYIDRTCHVLQDLSSGQAHLDSYCKELYK